MGRRMRAVRLVAAAMAAPAALSLPLAACGGGDDDVASSPTMPTAAAIVDPAAAGAGVQVIAEEARPGVIGALPALEVVRVASKETVQLQSLAEPGKPALLWFWAPHCTFCRGEAPELLTFEKTHGERLTILGLGAQDDYDQAVDFLADTGTQSLEMVWDRTGESWLHFKVTNQPTVLVIDADGRVTKKWFRNFDADGILDAAGLA